MNAAHVPAIPKPSADEIRRTLSVLFDPTDVVELRGLHKKRKRTDAGYFDAEHRDLLVEAAARLNVNDVAVYVTMNPLDPQILARCANRVAEFAKDTATDANVIRRRWLLVDIDPQRPKDTSATDLQLEAAKEKTRQVYAYLVSLGWPKPVVAESGNGMHLFARIDLPNDDASRDLLKRCLEALSTRFDDGQIKIDRAVFNAGRIVKLHGTIANKGDHVPPYAPWRASRLCTVPESIGTVSREQLEALAAEIAPKKPAERTSSANGRTWDEGNVAQFLARGNIEAVGPDAHEGALRWKLKACPFNPDHGFGEAAVFLCRDGRLGFECRHNSCQDKHWKDLRSLIDGPPETRNRAPRLELVHSRDEPASAPAPEEEVSDDKPAPLTARVFVWVDPKTLPPRQFLYGKHYIAGMLSATAGIGGAGKSSLTLVEAVSVAIGKDLFRHGMELPTGPLTVWIHNGEDPYDELQRRVLAVMKLYGVAAEDLGDRLRVTSGRDIPITLAREMVDPVTGRVVGRVLEPTDSGRLLAQEIKAHKVRIFIADPFVSLHRAPENDNQMIEDVLKIPRNIAHETMCAFEVAHHLRKNNGETEATVDDLRGASAITAACRSVRLVAPMTEQEAAEYGIDPEERRGYLWMKNGKANMLPPTHARQWFKFESCNLENPMAPFESDNVGVLTAWLAPDKGIDLTTPELRALRREITAETQPLNSLCYDIRSNRWAGKLIARVLERELDDKTNRRAIANLIERLITKGMLVKKRVNDPAKSRVVPIVQWAYREDE